MNQIALNIAAVREKIKTACARVDKNPGDIILLGATKQQQPEKILLAKQAGIDAVGENYVSELLGKYGTGAYDGIPLHFIGRLQSNKAKQLVGKASLIHSLCTKTGADSLEKQAKSARLVQQTLLQINVAGEDTKAGLEPFAVDAFLRYMSGLEHVCVRGLCAIIPQTQPDGYYFRKMQELFIDISAKKYDNVIMDYLSMGMSFDYEQAILYGANIVRIGSGIFGERVY